MERGDFRKVRGVNFIRVRGTAVERARAHGALLKDEAREGAFRALAKKNEWSIRRAPGWPSSRLAREALVAFYRQVLLRRLERRHSDEVRGVIHALSEETGIPYADVNASLLQGDGLMLLARLTVMQHRLGDALVGEVPGCTSAVALGEWTADGRLLACRNFDYPIVGPWEPRTTVVFSEPTERDQLPHVAVTTAGVHTAGLTAMNREGITLFTHAHFGRRVSLSGTPIVDIGNEVVRKARTLGQAIDIARAHRRYANWAFVLSSGRENGAAVVEMSPDRTVVREAEDGFIAHSNFFHSPELRAQEARISGAVVEDLRSRICRIRELLEAERGGVRPAHLSAALGDHIDRITGEERVVGNVVSVVTTLKSTVWEPSEQRFWVSARGESPMGLGEYLEVDVARFWTEEHAARGEAEWPVLPGYRPRDPALLDGVRHYRRAYRAFHMENDRADYRERALVALRKAARAYPSDAHLWMQAAILAFKLHEFAEAGRCLGRARALPLSPHSAGVCALYLARCVDLEGKREAAIRLYREAEGSTSDPKLLAASRKGLKRVYRSKDTGSILLDLQFPDTFQY